MKQKIKLIAFLAFCAVLVTASLNAGKSAWQHCEKCQGDPHKSLLVRK